MEEKIIIPDPAIQLQPTIQQKESIKLIKNSKGYNWEIKLLENKDIERSIIRLDSLNKEMEEKYGNTIKS